jgi:hypothetical protein
MSHAAPPLPCSIAINAMNSKQGWALSRLDGGPNLECAQMRYSPVVTDTDTDTDTDTEHDTDTDRRRRCVIHHINYPQKQYTGFETCQMCNSTFAGRAATTRQAAYKRKNICQACRSHKQAFLHLPTRWVFKYCHGFSRFENIAFFRSPSSGSCEERQSQKALWARQRRTRAAKEATATATAAAVQGL